jgi:putative restriction endonuclease
MGISMKFSDQLVPGHVYSREVLREMLHTVDATINNGVFRPAGYTSVLLFVTKYKTPDRTQYKDRLDGNVLHWEGQTSGRSDSLVETHRSTGLELLLFFREDKRQYPKAGFSYIGEFAYRSHAGSKPASFILDRLFSGGRRSK